MRKLVLAFLVLLPVTVTSAPGDQNTVTMFAWDPPANNVSGQPLNQKEALKGYKFYCGSQSGQYDLNNPVVINDPAATTVQITSIVSQDGEWYCAMTAFNNAGESQLSNEVAVKLQAGVATSLMELPPAAPAGLRLM